MIGLRSRWPAGIALLWVAACTDIQYRDRPPFNPPPDATSGYLGYYSTADRQTVCGNCHVGQQADWIQTLHSAAWDTLQANPAAQPDCEHCHTLNSRGNQPSALVGFDKVASDVYHDVQCESCHGPGYNHVTNPSVVANRPIPGISVYPTVPVADTAGFVNSACGGCHQGAGPSRNHNFLSEWRASRHGMPQPQGATATCAPCHDAKGVLAAWGVNTVYREQGTNTPIPQTCVVCHDPHGTAKAPGGQPLDGQLRYPIDSPVEEVNLCTHCHNRRSELAAAGSGPHGAQGPVLFGTAGYFPPGTVYDTTAILTTHGSTANPRLCAGCHVNQLTGVDAGGNPVAYVGHSFHPLPCLMPGSPGVVDTTFTNACPFDEPSRSWGACSASGCHPSAAQAISRFDGLRTEVGGYLNTIWVDANHNKVVDPFPTDSGYLAKVKLNQPGDLDNSTNTITPAKGALFNAQLTGDSLFDHPDGSHGVHNPFLYRALLQSSIADLLANYGGFLPAPPAPVLSRIQAAMQSRQLRMAPQAERAIMSPSRVGAAGNRVGLR
ncbi:MAG TPA: multiheme c-type cytochrome [Gemmatimonadales bacterium]|nr:multiheme c-type cytochrome [Gemmatimonadales bacterium]